MSKHSERSQALYARMADQLQVAIASHGYAPGDRLPPHRAFAEQFAVSTGTITKAFEILAARGVVRGEVGRGTFLEDFQSRREAGEHDLSRNNLPFLIDLDTLERCATRAMRQLVQSSRPAEPAGWFDHRQAYARWLNDLNIDIGQKAILITAGGQQSIDMILAHAVPRGGRLGVDPATYSGARAAAQVHDIALVALPWDDEGIDPAALQERLAARAIDALYVMPTAHSPFGVHMSRRRREDIVLVCRAHGTPIIEDDAFVVFRDMAMPTLKSLAPELVYYIASTNKSVSGHLRSGLVAPPPDQMEALVRIFSALVWALPPLTPAMFTEIVKAQEHMTITSRLRNDAERRLAIADQALPDWIRPEGLAMHVWLPMPLAEAERIARMARDRGILVTAPTATVIDATGGAGLRLCLGSVRAHFELGGALASLQKIITNPFEQII